MLLIHNSVDSSLNNYSFYHSILNIFSSFIICLTDSKTVSLICAFTFIPVKEWHEVPICDFTVMQEMDTTSILLLTDENPSSLLLVSVPGIYKIVLNIYVFRFCLK